MKRTVFRICLLLMAAGTLALTSCRHDRNQPGYAYMPDMYYSVPYDAYSPNPVLTGGITNQLPPDGTIPRGYVPYPYKPKSFEDQKKAGEELINPVPVSPASLSKGKEQYDIYCSMCHGTAGIGIRQQHCFIRAQYGCGFSHKMHAAKNDHISVSLRSFLAQLKRITQKVSTILHLWQLIVMTEDYGIALFF